MTLPPASRKVILSAASFADAEDALSIAVGLARRLESALAGFLVEDDRALAFAGLPHARTLATPRHAAQIVTQEKLLAAYQRDARSYRAKLAEMATNARVSWSFQHVRGRPQSPPTHETAAGDVLLIGHRRARHNGASVILVSSAAADAEAATLAQTLAQETGRRLDILVPARRPGNGHNQHTYDDLQDLMLRLGRVNATAIVLGADVAAALDLEQFALFARCPIVLPVQPAGKAS